MMNISYDNLLNKYVIYGKIRIVNIIKILLLADASL